MSETNYPVTCADRDCILPPDHMSAHKHADTSFTQSIDAMTWAEAFVGYVTRNPRIATDAGTMVGWFANAIMRGYDEGRRSATPAEAQSAGAREAAGRVPETDLEAIRQRVEETMAGGCALINKGDWHTLLAAARSAAPSVPDGSARAALQWVTERVNEGRGNVEFCLTENDGRIGVFTRGEPLCRGIGETAEDALHSAMRRWDESADLRVSRAAPSVTPEGLNSALQGVTRLTVVDHRIEATRSPIGTWEMWDVVIDPSLQDNSRTLKLFLTDRLSARASGTGETESVSARSGRGASDG